MRVRSAACLALLLLASTLDARPLRLLVRMRDAASPAGFPSSRTEALARLARLRQGAHAAQKRLLADLPKVRGVAANERGACGYWLTNCVAVSAEEGAIAELSARPDVKSVHVLNRVPCPKSVPAPAAEEDAQEFTWGLRALNVPQIRGLWGLTGKGIRVGHLDTGVDASHPDLRGKVAAWRDFSPDRRPAPYDPEGHGTHTAATIVGGNASGRWIGVAPDAKLISARIFSQDGADPEEILAAMQWVVDPDGNPATDDGAHLVSNSWGTDEVENRVFWDAVQRWVELGVFPCFAAGNNGPGTVGTPAGYPHAFAVGGVGPDRAVGDYSSRGPTRWDSQEFVKPDVVAPGTEILSAHAKGNLYQSLQGTSMAAPHVSGIIALMLEAKRDLKVGEIRRLLEDTAIDLGDPGKDNLTGRGLIDPLRVIGKLRPSAEAAGVVRDATGRAVAGAEVSVPRARLDVKSDGEGRFRVILPPGAWTLVTRGAGLAWSSAELTLAAGETRTHDVTLASAAAARIEGTVTASAEPKPLAARVIVSAAGRAVETDPSTGAFALDLPEGRHAVLVLAPGYAPRHHASVAVRAGAPVRLDVALDPRPDVLLVDDDESDLLERYYVEAIRAAGKTSTVWDTRALGEVPRDVLLAYPVVVWQTGFDYLTALTPAEQELVRQYLASGGRMWLAAQTAGATLRDTGFFTDVLHARWHGLIKREGANVPPIRGIAGDPIGDGLALGLNGPGSQENQEFPSMIGAASAAASPIATYVATPDPARPEAPLQAGPAGIRVDTGTYRVVYTGFGLDGIPEAAMRTHLTARVLGWLAPTPESAAARVALADRAREDAVAAGRADAAEWTGTTERLLEQARAELGRARDPWRTLAAIRMRGPHGDRLFATLRRGLR